MTIDSGGNSSNPRRNAKNFITNQAQARLDEVMPQVQSQGLNALSVDATEILYYSRTRGGYTCTCCATEVKPIETGTDDDDGIINIQPTALPFGKPNTSIFTQTRKPLFGERGEFTKQEDLDEDADDWLIQDDPELSGSSGTSSNMFSGTVDCGICYRTGFVPAYQLVNRTRFVLCTHNITDMQGFTINRTTAPHTFENLSMNGFVQFDIEIPKYFSRVWFGLRDNHAELYTNVFINNVPFSIAVFQANRGKRVQITVRDPVKFTHLVLEFEHAMPAVNANLSQLSRSTDYTNFDPIGNINIFLPMTLNRVEAGDLIWAPLKKLVLKVIDVTYSETAKNKHIEWQASCRVLQPTEPLKSIVLTRKI